MTVAGGATYHTSGQQYYESAATRALLQDYFGRDLADHEIASLVGAQPGMQVSVEYGQHRDAPALEFVVTGRVAQNPTAYSAHRLLFREADGTLTMGNAASHLAMGRGHGLGLHIFKDQVAALRHFNVARITTSANGNHNTLARGGTSGFYTWARFGFNGPIDWKYIHSELRALKLPPPGRAFLQARTTNDLMRLPGGAAEWKRVGQAFSGEFSLTPGSDALRLLDGYLQEKGVAWESTLEATALPFNHAWEQRAAQADALGDTVMPELTPVDEAILDRVWAALAAHTHHFVEQRCMVCGCGEPASDHGMPYPVRLPDEAASTFSPPWLTLYLPARLSQQLAVSGGEDVLDLHITLACLTGDATDWADPARFDRLRDMAQQWAATHDPQVIRISGVGRFTGDDTSYPLYASVDSLTIQAWRADLVQALDAAGFAVDTTYGYTPHITLAYLPQGTPPPDIQVPDVTATLDHLWCCVGDRRYAYPLGPAAQVDRAALVVDVARQLKADLLRDLEI